MHTVRKLNALLDPRSVADVGASRTPGKVGHDVVANLLAGGYDDKISPVNPHAREILGLPCHATIRQVPGPVDMALVAVSAARAAEAVRECGQADVRSIIVLSAGFKEVGPTQQLPRPQPTPGRRVQL